MNGPTKTFRINTLGLAWSVPIRLTVSDRGEWLLNHDPISSKENRALDEAVFAHRCPSHRLVQALEDIYARGKSFSMVDCEAVVRWVRANFTYK